MRFRDLLDWLGMTDGEFAALLALVATVAAVVTAIVRYDYRKPVQSVRILLGLPERVFAARSVDSFDKIQDPLAKGPDLLERRYIPLPVTSVDGDRDLLITVDEILRDPTRGSVIILGDAGTGKSTLLRAYLVSGLRRRARGWPGAPRERVLPFLVQLRQFAVHGRWDEPNPMLAYLMWWMTARLGLRQTESQYLLRRALQRRRLVVLLDGLDEVSDDRRERVRIAVNQFRSDVSQDCPTAQARVVLTCRQHNFRVMRDEWVSVIAGDGGVGDLTGETARLVVYSLAPLRDGDIQLYVDKARDKFNNPSEDPDRYLVAVRDSPTLDMHRIPLVLATSVNYYAQRNTIEIPSEIGKLYQHMVTDMLTRHDFVKEPGARLQAFNADDKERFLREFAAANALQSVPENGFTRIDVGESFGPFDERALYQLAAKLADRMDKVSDYRAFVREILTHSGLLQPAGEARWEFAHRTLQEFLVAEYLVAAEKAGEEMLLQHACDGEWQQVAVFYAGTSAKNQDSIGAFLHRLTDRNLALAGYCLRSAKPTNEVGDRIQDALVDRIKQGDAQLTSYLAALLSTTLSPRDHIRRRGVELVNGLLDELIDRFDVYELLGGNVDSVVHLLDALSQMEAGHIARLVPQVISATPNDPRLVPPLWRCLRAEGIEVERLGVSRIVERLVVLVMDEDCLRQLQAQPSNNPPFATEELRSKVHPVSSPTLRRSNLVELLCWVDHLQIDVLEPNRFLHARQESPELFARVERDRPRTVRLQLFPFGLALSGLGMLAALALAGVTLVTDWQVVTRPHGWATLWWVATPPVLAATVFLVMFGWAERSAPAGFAHRYLSGGRAPGAWQSGNLPAEILARVFPGGLAQVLFGVSTFVYALALAPLLTKSVAGYLAAVLVTIAVLVWLPLSASFDRGRRVYLRRPNPYADMYDDPRSAHWLVPDGQQLSAPTRARKRS